MGMIKMSDLNEKALDAKRKHAKAKEDYDRKVAQGHTHCRPPLSKLTPSPLYDSLPDDSWKGQRAFVVGGGPSLKGFDFGLIEGERVIACNRAFESCRPDIILAIDTQFWGWVESGKFGEESKRAYYEAPYRAQVCAAPFPFPPEVSTIEHCDIRELVNSYKHGLPYSGNTGLAGLLLAYFLGADPIYLLGFDLISNGGNTRNFHDGYPQVQKDDVYPDMAELFGLYAEDMSKHGTSIINLNPESGLTYFRKMSPEKLFTDDWKLEQAEKQKYDRCWEKDYSSQMPLALASYIKDTANGKDGRQLELGCGNGKTVDYLRDSGFSCFGVDISLSGVRKRLGFIPDYFTRATLWRLPFPDNYFEYTFSTDVLEHLPPSMVDQAIKELFRVTSKQTFHKIATFPDKQDGVELHLTVQPIEWWLNKFGSHWTKDINVVISERRVGDGPGSFNEHFHQLSGRR